ncbi:MAG: hypothetical protein KC912_05000 [Proteobacteria bacterium]|nr:hypothetical protein [Pseudomonadota bacterium]
MLRFDPSWTRDTWGRAEGPHEPGWTWTVLRDQGSGFVFVVLVTSPTLLTEHPRLDVRQVTSREEAVRVAASFGDPPLAQADAWG